MHFLIDSSGRIQTSSDARTAVATVVESDLDTATALPQVPLTNRRWLLLAFPSDLVLIGDASVSSSNGYGVRGTGRGSDWDKMSRRGDYSSRFQFLRGQYVTLALSDEVDVYGTVPGAVEDVVVLELA